MRTHILKTWPSFYQAVIDGTKTFEVRENDRDFAVGDKLELREWEPPNEHTLVGSYTDREAHCLVTYVLSGGRFGIAPNTVVMGLRLIEVTKRAARK